MNPDTRLSDGLADALRALREDVPPARDLWPVIASRLQPHGAGTHPAHRTLPRQPRHHRRRNLGYAAAAAVVLAVAAGSHLLPLHVHETPVPVPALVASTPVAEGAATDPGAPLLVAADALAREYQGALREIEASAAIAATAGGPGDRATPSQARLAADLERSATEVRAALARDPDALHLFHRLQHIYSHRLALSLHQAPPQEFHS